MGGAGSGPRRKSMSKDDAQRRMTLLAPVAVEMIRETIEGINKDRLRYEAAVEVYNHNFGKPKQSTDLDIRGGRELGAGFMVELYKLMAQRRAELDYQPTVTVEQIEQPGADLIENNPPS